MQALLGALNPEPCVNVSRVQHQNVIQLFCWQNRDDAWSLQISHFDQTILGGGLIHWLSPAYYYSFVAFLTIWDDSKIIFHLINLHSDKLHHFSSSFTFNESSLVVKPKFIDSFMKSVKCPSQNKVRIKNEYFLSEGCLHDPIVWFVFDK